MKSTAVALGRVLALPVVGLIGLAGILFGVASAIVGALTAIAAALIGALSVVLAPLGAVYHRLRRSQAADSPSER